MPAECLRVALVDDHPPILAGALAAISKAFEVTGSSTQRHVAGLLGESGPFDIVLLDVQLGDGTDPEDNVRAVVERGWPVLLYTQVHSQTAVARCFRAGASGIVGKHEDLSVLVEAVRLVVDGQPYLSGDWAEALDADASQIPGLTPREAEALRLYATGLPMKAVAHRMGISPQTVKEFLIRVRRRYSLVGRPAPTKTDLLIRALEDGYVEDLDDVGRA